MAKWINRVVIGSTGTGSTTETYDPNSGTVLSGTAFTPTAGRFLVAIIGGPVTSTTPSGWTLPSLASAINNNGLYVFTKTAAGSDTAVSTHNGDGTYPTIVEFLEFPAGTTFIAADFSNNSASSAGTASPVVSGLTGTNLHMSALTFPSNVGGGWDWTAGTEDTDVAVGPISPKFVEFSTAYAEDSTASSTNFAVGRTPSGTGTERVTFVLNVPSGPVIINRTADLTGTGTLSATRVMVQRRTAALSGTGALSAARKAVGIRAANLTGTGTLSASAVKITPTLRILNSSSVNMPVVLSRTANFTGAGALTATRVIVQVRAAGLPGTGTLSATRVVVHKRAASFEGVGALSATRVVVLSRTAEFGGSGALTAAWSVVGLTRTAAFGGTGTLIATRRIVLSRTAAFGGTGLLTAIAVIPLPDIQVTVGAPQLRLCRVGSDGRSDDTYSGSPQRAVIAFGEGRT